MFYRFAQMLVRFFLFLAFRIRVTGRENMPVSGAAILAVNHRSNWDVLVVGAKIPRKLRFMAKSEMFSNRLFSWILHHVGAFPIQRGKGDIGAIKGALTILKQDEVLLMFPEGRRIRDGARVHAKTGVAMLAVRGKVPVIPVSVSGNYHFRGHVALQIGKPVTFEAYYGQKLEPERLQQLSDGILDNIRSLAGQEGSL